VTRINLKSDTEAEIAILDFGPNKTPSTTTPPVVRKTLSIRL
jgi:hypothetical protein